MIFRRKRVQYIAHYEIYVGGNVTDWGNLAFDSPEGESAVDLYNFVQAQILKGAGSPAGGQCMIVGLFRL